MAVVVNEKVFKVQIWGNTMKDLKEISPRNRIHSEYVRKRGWDAWTAEWQALSFEADKAKREGRNEDYQLFSMQAGINRFDGGEFENAADYFRDSGNLAWAEQVGSFAEELEQEQAEYDERIHQSRIAAGNYAALPPVVYNDCPSYPNPCIL